MTLVDTNKAVEYFKAKLDFTTGPVELKRMLEAGENVNVVDVRYAEDYQLSHVPGAINLPRDRWDSLEGLEHGKVNILYCYSQACRLAAAAALLFAENGFSVMELEGGFDEWQNHGFDTQA